MERRCRGEGIARYSHIRVFQGLRVRSALLRMAMMWPRGNGGGGADGGGVGGGTASVRACVRVRTPPLPGRGYTRSWLCRMEQSGA